MASFLPVDFLLPLADRSALPLSDEHDGWAGVFHRKDCPAADLWPLASGFAHHSWAETNLGRHGRAKGPTQPSRGKILAVRKGRGAAIGVFPKMARGKNRRKWLRPGSSALRKSRCQTSL